MILNTRTILSTTTTNLNNTVLLNIVTLTRNDSSNDLSRTQPHTSNLALARIGLLGLSSTSLQTDTLQRRVILQGWGPTAARALALPTASADLVVGCADDGRTGELAVGGGGQELGCRCRGSEDGLEVEACGEGVCSAGEASGGGGEGAKGGA